MIQGAFQSRSLLYYEGKREEVLKNINRPEKRKPLSLSLFSFLSLSLPLCFSHIAPFWCLVTNCFHCPAIIFPAEDSHGENEEERKAIRTRRERRDDREKKKKVEGERKRERDRDRDRESRNKNRINGPSYHARWAIKYRRKYPPAV